MYRWKKALKDFKQSFPWFTRKKWNTIKVITKNKGLSDSTNQAKIHLRPLQSITPTFNLRFVLHLLLFTSDRTKVTSPKEEN